MASHRSAPASVVDTVTAAGLLTLFYLCSGNLMLGWSRLAGNHAYPVSSFPWRTLLSFLPFFLCATLMGGVVPFLLRSTRPLLWACVLGALVAAFSLMGALQGVITVYKPGASAPPSLWPLHAATALLLLCAPPVGCSISLRLSSRSRPGGA